VQASLGGGPGDPVAVFVGQRGADSSQQPAADFRFADGPHLAPEHECKVVKIIAPAAAALIGEAVVVGRAAAAGGPLVRRPFHESGLHEPLEPLPHGRGRDPERIGQVADARSAFHAEHVQEGGVRTACEGARIVVRGAHA